MISVLRRFILFACACALALGNGAAYAAEDEQVVVRDASSAGFPQVQLELALPSSLVSGSSSTPDFTVEENGRVVEVAEAASSEVEPIDVVLLIDTSGSMSGESMAAGKGAAQAFIDELEPGSRVAVVSFADKPRVVSPMIEAGEAIRGAVARLEARGETALYDALALAAQEAGRAEVSRPVVVLLSDGGDTVSRVKLDAALKDLKEASAPVLVVALPSAEADFATLRSIARQTGGRFATVGKASDLIDFYKSLARELQTTWNLTYVSRRPSTKDLEIVVNVDVGGESVQGSTVVPNPLFTDPLPTASESVVPAPPASTLTLAVAVGLVFAAVFAFIAALAFLLIKPKTGLDNLKYYDQVQGAQESMQAEDHTNVVTSSVLGAVDYVAGKRGMKRLAYEQLERAGLPLRPIEYITIHLVSVITVGIVAEIVFQRLAASILAIVAATVIPLVYVEMRVTKRKNQFNEQLPDVLNLMAGSLRAGWGLQQSLDLVIEQMAPPVSTEFARAETEVRLGRPVEEALATVAARMQSDDFGWAVTAIGIQRDVGGNLAEVLDIVASTIRDRGALRRQIAGLTAEGRLSAWILMLLPFALVLLLSFVNPEYLAKLVTTTQGLVMLALGCVLLVVGAIWMRKIVVIEV